MMEERPITDWLPITKKEVEKRGWDELDVILISGDAYVDHPSFGTAVIGRIIEDEGFKIGILKIPDCSIIELGFLTKTKPPKVTPEYD